MFIRLLAVASIAMAGSAGAQMIKTPLSTPREYQFIHLGDPRITHEEREEVDCLRHKKSGRVICKHRDDWRALAARLDALKPPTSVPK